MVVAEEGTAAHDFAEHKLKKALKMRSKKPFSMYDSDEMTDVYVEYCLEVIEKAKEHCKDLQILIDQKLDFSDYVEGGFGTGDLVIVGTGTLQVIDFKYGRGVIVAAEKNPQMMLYALGTLSLFDMLYDIKKVTMTIVQPRVDNFSTYEITVDELLKWAEEELKPKAELALKGEGEFCPGEHWRFCKAKNQCRARAVKNKENVLSRSMLTLDMDYADDALQEGGCTIIWFSLTWSLGLYQQANARLYRQGQKHTVVIHHIIAKDTIVINLLSKKVKVELEDFALHLIKDLQEIDYDVEFTGFEPPEIDELFNELHPKGVKEDGFDEAPPEVPITKNGDIWLLGRHCLICGDSTKLETYEKLMEGKKVNLVVTDPPYNVSYEGTAGKIQNDNMEDKKFYEFLLNAYKGMYESLADGGSIYVFHADRETVNFRVAFKDAGFFCHQTCIWIKNSPVLGRCDYQYNHEPILVGWKPTAGHKFYGDRKQRTTWNFDRPTKSKYHSTMKLYLF